MHNCIQLYTLYQFINYATFYLFEFSICWGDRDCIKIKCYLTIYLTVNWYIPTSFWAASACSTSDISLLFSRSLVAGVRWSSSRSGIFLVKKAWHWLTTLLVAYNNIVIWTVQLERFTYHDFATYTRILSSNVVLKYSSKLTVILKRFYIICKISFYVSSTTSLSNQDGGIALSRKRSYCG